jgi:hypothetical protein
MNALRRLATIARRSWFDVRRSERRTTNDERRTTHDARRTKNDERRRSICRQRDRHSSSDGFGSGDGLQFGNGGAGLAAR